MTVKSFAALPYSREIIVKEMNRRLIGLIVAGMILTSRDLVTEASRLAKGNPEVMDALQHDTGWTVAAYLVA